MRNKPDIVPPSQEEREKILAVALKKMAVIDGKVYGLEDDAEQESIVDCGAKTLRSATRSPAVLKRGIIRNAHCCG